MAEVTGLRNNALPYPVRGVPYGIVAPLLDADGDLIAGAAGLDSEVSKNGDTFADCTNEATEIATSSGLYYVLLTATEMEADVVSLIIKTSTSGGKTTPIVLYPKKLPTLRSGTAQAGAAGSITLDSGASAIDDFYNGALVVATLDGAVEARIITDYVGSTKVASVTPNWNTTPDSDDTFIIYLPDGVQIQDANLVAWLATVPLALTSQMVQVSVGAMQAAVITATSIASDAITAAKIAADAITSSKIADGAMTAAKFASGAFDAVWSVTTRILTAGTNIVLAKGTGVTGFNDLSAAQVNAEADAAIETYHLDHLLAATYDPASKPGAADALLNELVENDGGVARYTANALEQAPTGGSAPTVGEIAGAVWDEATSGHTTSGTFGKLVADLFTDTQALVTRIPAALFSGITSMAQWLGLIAGKQTGNSTARTELRATGAGSGTFDETTDSTQAIRDRGDAAWITATGFSTHSAADVWAVATRTLTAFDSSFKTGYALSAAGVQAIWDALTSALTTVGSIGKLLVDRIDAAISSRSSHSAAGAATAVRSELTTELGRIDVAVSTRASQTSVDTIDDFLDTEIAAILAAVDTELAAVKTVTDQFAAAQSEPSAVPAANATPLQKIAWLAALARNKVTQTATTQALRNDADSADIATAAVSDDGTTFERSEWQ